MISDLALVMAAFALLLGAASMAMCLGLARQLGVLLVRIGPSRPLVTTEGPAIGDLVSFADLGAPTLDGARFRATKGLLVLFMSATCSTCDALIPAAQTFARAYARRIAVACVVKTNGQPELHPQYSALIRSGVEVLQLSDLHDRLSILGTPYALLLDSEGRMLSKGVVNNLDEIESLLEIEAFAGRRHASRATLELEPQLPQGGTGE